MSKFKIAAQKVLVSVTMVTTLLSLGGFAALPATALAVAPADYGLHEGDVISADGTAGTAGYDPDLYIVNELGYKRLFLNPAIFSFYGHLGGFAAVKHVAPATRDAFPTSGLFRNCESNDQAVWGVQVTGEDTGVLHHIALTGAEAASQDPNFFKKVFCINNNEANWYPKGSDYTSLNQVPDYNRGGTGATPTPTVGGLNGSVGSLNNADYVGSLNNEEVGEGENNIAVAGVDLDVDSGSDIRLLAVKVAFREDGGDAASADLDDYADNVSIWLNGSKVGDADVSDFDEDADVWSATIVLDSDAVVRMSQTEDLRVAVSALSTIDSTDLDNDDWEVAIESLRFVDAQGAITTEDSIDGIHELNSVDAGSGNTANRPFDFVSFATGADLELELNEASDNPESRVVNIDNSSSTDDVVLLTGNLDATGDITVKGMIVHIATAGATFEGIADSVSLEVDGTVVQTLQSTECSNASITACNFDDVDADINDGDRVKFRVLADINGDDDISSSQTPSLTATMESDADLDAEDENGDTLAAADLTGTAVGEAQGFMDEGIMVSFVSASESKTSPDTGDDVGTFVVKFDVQSFDTNAYVDNTCAFDAGAPAPTAAGQGTIYSLASVSADATNLACDLDAEASADETSTGNFEVLNGQTVEFTLTVTATSSDNFVSLFLESINWASSDVSADQFYTFNLDEFETDTLFLEGN